MKIADSTIQMASQHSALQRDEQKERLRVWKDGQQPLELTAEGSKSSLKAQAEAAAKLLSSDTVTLSDKAKGTQPTEKELSSDSEMGPMDDLKSQVVKMLVKQILGREIAILDPLSLQGAAGGGTATDAAAQAGAEGQAGQSAQGGQQAERAGWGVTYDYYESHVESESTSFSAQGVVHTTDGKEIQISAEINMSRSFTSQQSVSLRAGDALKDPLVINFNGTAAQLTETKFSFDIDADGRQDQIHFVTPDSGFLALDKNGDGKVNNGTELFGAQSGNGFADLAKYDGDRNNWIDENDAIYKRLRIWSKDSQGNDQLIGLGQTGVGAIYLGNITTKFDLKDTTTNELQGQVQASGLYLQESGGAGSVQQIDLVA